MNQYAQRWLAMGNGINYKEKFFLYKTTRRLTSNAVAFKKNVGLFCVKCEGCEREF